MRLAHFDIDYVFDFDKQNTTYSLVIENSMQYFNLVKQLIDQNNGKQGGGWILSQIDKELSLQDNVVCVYNFFDLNLNSKKIESVINNEVLKVIKEKDLLREFEDLSKLVLKINDEILSNIDLPIDSSDDITYENFIKLSNYKITEEIDILNKIVTYVDLFVKLKNIKLVILVDCFAVLSEQDMQKLLKQFNYMDCNVLLINSQNKYTFNDVKKCIIDEDLCII